MSSKIETIDVTKASDWDLIVAVGLYSRKIVSLNDKQRDFLHRAIYNLNDAYGEVGFVPPQGYDWSGLRDSSEKAQKAMGGFVRNYLLRMKLETIEVEVTG